MNLIAIIPARGGSKRIPRKNVKPFMGKPILAYPIAAALESGIFTEVMVSTDDSDIADVARSYGAHVPFMRSPEQSGDQAGTAPVLMEVLREYERRGQHFDVCACLYPCAPFITAETLRSGMRLLQRNGIDAVLPVVRFSYPPQRGLVIRDGRAHMLHPENYSARSQDLEPCYHDAGQFYFIKAESLFREGRLFCAHTLPLELPETEVQDIDTEEDWALAEMKYRLLHQGQP